ncbi:MAG: radical SAM protein [Planctomycetes bacterium]|nr:radical SAM protein [Planctomycetota bacterium]
MTAQSDTDKELAPIHDFGNKLLQPSLIDSLKEYVRWQVQIRASEDPEPLFADGPDRGPVSINLDLTTACNYACDHCVDMDILNMGIKYEYDRLVSSLERLCDKGLRSCILIGGGEPTVFPKFPEIVALLKGRGVKVAVVSNGSGMRRIEPVAHLFDADDWVRLSLDSGTDPTFQAMHKPKKPISLEQICADVKDVKSKFPGLRIGFSFIVTWKGAFTNDTKIVENIHEIEAATQLAKDHLFDYISVKPFLVRSPDNNAEIVGVDDSWTDFEAITARIRAAVEQAKRHETATFKVVESTNLRVLENQSYANYTKQPRQCHFTYFRQVLSPLGLYNCPVYRHVEQAKLGGKHSYATEESAAETRANVGRLIQSFDASCECKEVTCLYNSANWMVEDLIQNPEKLDQLEPAPERNDFFL